VEIKNNREDPKEIVFKRRFSKGTHKLGIAFLNDYFNKDEQDPNKRDRNLIVNYIHITGPLDGSVSKLPDSHTQLIQGQSRRQDHAEGKPRKKSSSASPAELSAARRRSRRSTGLVALTEKSRAEGETFEQGIQLALQAVLISPHFIYKVELDPPGPRGAAARSDGIRGRHAAQLPALEQFAGRRCVNAGLEEENAPTRATIWKTQVRRLLKDPRSKGADRKLRQPMAGTAQPRGRTPDLSTFPSYDAKLRAAMRRETGNVCVDGAKRGPER